MSNDTLEELELKNGTRAPKALIITTTLAINSLLSANPMAFLWISRKMQKWVSRNIWYFENTIESYGLMQDGKIHNSVKNIALCSFQGEGLELSFVSPLVSSKTPK